MIRYLIIYNGSWLKNFNKGFKTSLDLKNCMAMP